MPVFKIAHGITINNTVEKFLLNSDFSWNGNGCYVINACFREGKSCSFNNTLYM